MRFTRGKKGWWFPLSPRTSQPSEPFLIKPFGP